MGSMILAENGYCWKTSIQNTPRIDIMERNWCICCWVECGVCAEHDSFRASSASGFVHEDIVVLPNSPIHQYGHVYSRMFAWLVVGSRTSDHCNPAALNVYAVSCVHIHAPAHPEAESIQQNACDCLITTVWEQHYT